LPKERFVVRWWHMVNGLAEVTTEWHGDMAVACNRGFELMSQNRGSPERFIIRVIDLREQFLLLQVQIRPHFELFCRECGCSGEDPCTPACHWVEGETAANELPICSTCSVALNKLRGERAPTELAART
jgi:hypothetical protein